MRRISVLDRASALLVVGFFLVVALLPPLYMLSTSLMSTGRYFSGALVPDELHFANYVDAWISTRIGTLFMNSVLVSGSAVVLTIALSAPVGYAISRLRFAGRNALFIFLLLGLTLPTATILLPLFFNMRVLHLLDTPVALIAPYTALGIPFGVFIMKGFFDTLPRELEEAARIDGAGNVRIFAQILFPLTRPAVATVGVFLFLSNWNEFLFALTFVSSPDRRTLPTGIYALISTEFYGNYPTLAAALVVFALPVVALYFALQREFTGGLTAGAVKG